MAKVFSLVDDFDGKASADVQTREFVNPWTGKRSEIDLSEANWNGMVEALNVYVSLSRVSDWRPSNGVPNDSDRQFSQAAREWAKRSGREIADRGRVSAEILDEYRKHLAEMIQPKEESTPEESAPETPKVDTSKGRKASTTSAK